MTVPCCISPFPSMKDVHDASMLLVVLVSIRIALDFTLPSALLPFIALQPKMSWERLDLSCWPPGRQETLQNPSVPQRVRPQESTNPTTLTQMDPSCTPMMTRKRMMMMTAVEKVRIFPRSRAAGGVQRDTYCAVQNLLSHRPTFSSLHLLLSN